MNASQRPWSANIKRLSALKNSYDAALLHLTNLPHHTLWPARHLGVGTQSCTRMADAIDVYCFFGVTHCREW